MNTSKTKESLVKSTKQGNECLRDYVILHERSSVLQNGPEDICIAYDPALQRVRIKWY